MAVRRKELHTRQIGPGLHGNAALVSGCDGRLPEPLSIQTEVMVIPMRIGDINVVRINILADGLWRTEIKRRSIHRKQFAGREQVRAARGHARGIDLHQVSQDQARRLARSAV